MPAFHIKNMMGETNDPNFDEKLEKWLLEHTSSVQYQYEEQPLSEEDE